MARNTSQKSPSGAAAPTPEFVKGEEDVLRLWDQKNIFQKTLEQTRNGKPFVFFEGPPTANGKPGIHHVLARVFKDIIIRYQTMNGHYVDRRAGWDTHGLPVELTVEKELGISGKKQIENIVENDARASIAEFNARCKKNVTSLIPEWERMTRRIGYWLDFENDYRTYRNEYMESLWWIIKQMAERSTAEGPLLYKGHKVVPHCPRCETALSSHEVAQGYRSVQDTSVYVKFKIKKTNLLKAQSLIEAGKEVNILSWTTTPWTLPGNVALAVDPKLTYVLVKHEESFVILAESLVERVFETTPDIELSFRGEDLLKTVYEPLFSGAVDRGSSQTAWTVLGADFVTADDGTGVVHTAVMYGEDDYQLGVQTGLPAQHTVSPSGHFTDRVKGLAGAFVKDKHTERTILDMLHEQQRVFRIEPFTHDYPFCWRCNTPLLYYAKESWFVRMSALRKALLKSNNTIHWEPGHIKEGRFGEWLREAKDWAFSRERYWGTPLPIWECTACGTTEIIGSFAELRERAIKKTLPAKKREVFLMRHGMRSDANETGGIQIRCVKEKDNIVLTEEGKKQVETEAKKVKGKIDLIITSDFKRTRQSADIVSRVTGAQVIEDDRLREYFIPSFEGKTEKELKAVYPDDALRLHQAPEGGETLRAAGKRVEECIIDSVQRYPGSRILFMSHGDPLWAFAWVRSGKNDAGLARIPYPNMGAAVAYTLSDIPLNPHRPYIDQIELPCNCAKGKTMKRVEEVADVWFDSGAMPFAQDHYPFEHQQDVDSGTIYPADYISEAIDQTRGWFYTLLAVATVLEKSAPYKNVISLGHILDEKGEKMSKSKGNVVDPWNVIAETGSDALRFHFYSMNQPGDPKLFSLDGVRDVLRKTFMIFWNVVSFYLLYARPGIRSVRPQAIHPLDQWLLSRLEQVRRNVTTHLEQYTIFEASRELKDFITELSTWYVRRSRARIKEDEPEARNTLGYTLYVLAQCMAPFAPLFSEQVFLKIKGNAKLESIHLSSWPAEAHDIDETLIAQMTAVRQSVELFHSIRKEQGIKSRQPLQEAQLTVELQPRLQDILKEEINVDTVSCVNTIQDRDHWIVKEKGDIRVALYIELTPELKERGVVRDVIRHINDLRKLARLTPDDQVDLYVKTQDDIRALIERNANEIQEQTKSASVTFDMPENVSAQKHAAVDAGSITLGLLPRA